MPRLRRSDHPPGLAPMAIFGVSFLPDLPQGKSAAPNDPERRVGTGFRCRCRESASDLQDVSIAGDHLVQHGIDEEPKKEARDQAGNNHDGKRPLRIRTDAGGERRRQ